MKRLSANQLLGQQGERLVEARTLAMGFSFQGFNRLETGIDGFIELRDTTTGQTLGKWIGAQVKTTKAEAYSREDDNGFEYLLRPEDLDYWHGSNVPVIIVLVRLSDDSMYWQSVDAGTAGEPRRLRFSKLDDKFEKGSADRVAALCIDRDRHGSYVPPMLSGEVAHITMVRTLFPEKIYVGASLFASGHEAAKELAAVDNHAPFDWVVRSRRFLSFRDPRGTSLREIVDEGSVEEVEVESVALTDDLDEEYVFIDLLGRTLSAQFDSDLTYDKESHALYFRAPAQNTGRTYRYRSLVNETSADVVSVWRGKGGYVGSVRHHAFVPRFQRIADDWFLSVSPTFVFTHDGYRSHYNSGALIAGKKKLEKNGAIRGQFVMWRHLLTQSDQQSGDLLTDGARRPSFLRFEALEPIEMPLSVPEEAWRRDDPNASSMVDNEWLI